MTSQIVWIDGFGHYTTVADKYDVVSGTPPSIGAVGKFGTGIECGTGNNKSCCRKTGLPASDYVLTGCYFNPKVLASAKINAILGIYVGGEFTIKLYVSADGKINVDTKSGGSAASVSTVDEDTWYYVEMAVKRHSSTGTIKVTVWSSVSSSSDYLDLSSVNTTDANAPNGYDGLAVGDPGATDSTQIYISDVWAAFGDSAPASLGPQKVLTDLPNGAGANTDWTPSAGSNYQCVDENPTNTTDYVTSAAQAKKDTYALPAISDGISDVNAVAVTIFAKKDDTPNRSVAPMVSSNTNEELGSAHALTASYKHYQSIFELNPDGDVAWTESTASAVKCGQKVTV